MSIETLSEIALIMGLAVEFLAIIGLVVWIGQQILSPSIKVSLPKKGVPERPKPEPSRLPKVVTAITHPPARRAESTSSRLKRLRQEVIRQGLNSESTPPPLGKKSGVKLRGMDE